MADDDYDLVPHSELRKLESEVKQLKGSTSPISAPDNMQNLTKSINDMVTIFNEAKDELRVEDEEKELLTKKIDPMMRDLSTLLDQNAKIAEGILSVADMIKKLEARMDGMKHELSERMDQIATAPPIAPPEPAAQPPPQRMAPPAQQQMPPPMQGQAPPMQQQMPPPMQNQQPPMGGAPPGDDLLFGNSPVTSPPPAPTMPPQGAPPGAPPVGAGMPPGGDDLFKTDAPGMPPPPPPKPSGKKGLFGR